ncbi:MAG: alpha/beta fold hydrolase [Phycisphaerales bacterium]
MADSLTQARFFDGVSTPFCTLRFRVMREFRIPDIQVCLESGRSGPLAVYRSLANDRAARPVIYIHGSPANAWWWKRYLERPIAGTRTILIDRPGFGRSDWGGPVVSFADQAGAVAALLDTLKAEFDERPILLGHSFGGAIAARVAIDHPDRIAGLIIAAGVLSPSLKRLSGAGRTGHAFRWVLPRGLRHCSAEYLAAVEQLEELRPMLRMIEPPVLMVHGKRDLLVPCKDVNDVQREFTGAASLRVVKLSAGHFFPWLREEEFREIIAAF